MPLKGLYEPYESLHGGTRDQKLDTVDGNILNVDAVLNNYCKDG